MNQKAKSIALAGLAVAAVFALLAMVGWWVLRDLGTTTPTPNGSSKQVYRSPWSQEADHVPLGVIPASPDQPAPMP